MPNPLLENNIFSSNASSQLMQLYNAYKFSSNPKAFIENNPQLKQLQQMSRGNAKQVFYELCKQKGVDPETILSQLK